MSPTCRLQSFFEPQSHRVDGPQVDRDSLDRAGIDDLVDLRDGEDFGKRLGTFDFQLTERVPVTRAGDAKEELECRRR